LLKGQHFNGWLSIGKEFVATRKDHVL
jgi:hypothetical protein